jgi:hypothetical protein
MRVTVEVELDVPSSLLGDKPRKKRGIEDNLEVVVSMGGKVGIRLEIMEEGLGLVAPATSSHGDEDSEHSVLERMQEKVQETAASSLRRLLVSVSWACYVHRKLTGRTKAP